MQVSVKSARGQIACSDLRSGLVLWLLSRTVTERGLGSLMPPAQVLVGCRRFNVGTILGQGETGRQPSKEISGFLERSHWIRGAIVRINDLSNAPAS